MDNKNNTNNRRNNANQKPKRPSLLESLKSGAIVIAKQDDILKAIKSDESLYSLTDQNYSHGFASIESMEEITGLKDGTYISAQKFAPRKADGSIGVPVIVWCPTNYKDILAIYGIVEGDEKDMIHGGPDFKDLKNFPSFLGKNLKKVFMKIEEPKFEVETFVISYVNNEEYTLANNTFYRLYVDESRRNNFKINSLKATRDNDLSPKKQKSEDK